jgi:ribosomal protein S4
MGSDSQNQQAIALFWVVAVLFCAKNHQDALQQIRAGAIKLNGETILDPLYLVRVGDTLVFRDDHRPLDLYGLRKTQELYRKIEAFSGGKEAMYRRLGIDTPPAINAELE